MNLKFEKIKKDTTFTWRPFVEGEKRAKNQYDFNYFNKVIFFVMKIFSLCIVYT
jgi:hypothetical protein